KTGEVLKLFVERLGRYVVARRQIVLEKLAIDFSDRAKAAVVAGCLERLKGAFIAGVGRFFPAQVALDKRQVVGEGSGDRRRRSRLRDRLQRLIGSIQKPLDFFLGLGEAAGSERTAEALARHPAMRPHRTQAVELGGPLMFARRLMPPVGSELVFLE